jgi:hypothetical protein
MKLIPGWRRTMTRAWSIRLMAIAAVLSGLEVAVMFWVPDWPDGVLAALSGLITLAAFVARIFAQQNMEN